MKTKTCHWDKCKTKIQVDTSIEERQSFFTVVGWCPVHQEAFKIFHDLEKKFAKENNIDWPIGSLSYKKHKKALHELYKLSGQRAEQIAENKLNK